MQREGGAARVMEVVGRLLDRINRGVEVFSTAILFFAVFIVLLQIFFRMVLDRGGAVRWVWESIILVNVWLTYLGASVLAKDQRNIALRAQEKLGPKAQAVLRGVVRFVVLATSILVVRQTVKLVGRQMNSRFVTIPFLTRGHGSIVIVIGFCLIGTYAIYDIVSQFVGPVGDTPGRGDEGDEV
jgi:TRAP-type C4-dicarboxylate transport system permease small subunit